MKTIKVPLLIIISTLLWSCEEVIDLPLANSQPVLVIEGNISNQLENQVVTLSKTIPFTQSNTFNPVPGARVELIMPSGAKIPYHEVQPGIYQSPLVAGISGQQYTLQVTTEGKIYTATSTMPEVVTLDSISLKKIDIFGETNTYPVVHYNDPAATPNQYRYLLKIDGDLKHTTVAEDRFNNGNTISDIVFQELKEKEIEPGALLELELQCIDRNVFRYFFAIQQISGEGGPPVSPANPVSNFNNGALGIFNAHTSSKINMEFK